MIYVLLGVGAFVFLFLFDLSTFNNQGIKKKIFGVLGVGLLVYAGVMATFVSDKIFIPFGVRIVSGVLCIVFGFLLIYSLFIELPFVRTYGKRQYSSSLVDTGTYALCRHPGVLWFGLLFCFYFFATGALLIIICGVVWTCMDILHVYIQEKYFFPSMFSTYERYMETTPMLIPNKKSTKKCIKTIFRRGIENGYTRENVKKTRV